MPEFNSSNLPDWNKIFALRPDLEPPGYRETVELLKNPDPNSERENMAQTMRRLHKERLSAKNKSRSANRRALAPEDGVNPPLSVNKRRGKNR